MSPKSLIVIACLTMLSAVGAALPAAAQTTTPSGQGGLSVTLPRRAHPRIEVNPRPLLYRRCIDWYELQDRPSGTVLYPRMHCWWVRG